MDGPAGYVAVLSFVIWDSIINLESKLFWWKTQCLARLTQGVFFSQSNYAVTKFNNWLLLQLL